MTLVSEVDSDEFFTEETAPGIRRLAEDFDGPGLPRQLLVRRKEVDKMEKSVRETLEHVSGLSAEEAKEKAFGEYDKFRLIQDREYFSDFDKEIKNWKELGLFDEDNSR